jgi:diguanylate cyclase (GGDEF)-like protein
MSSHRADKPVAECQTDVWRKGVHNKAIFVAEKFSLHLGKIMVLISFRHLAPARWLIAFSLVSAFLMMAIAAVVLVGWRWDIPSLTSFGPGQASLKPLAAIGFTISGAALLVHNMAGNGARIVAILLSLFVVGAGATGFLAYEFGIDRLGSDADALSPQGGSTPMSRLAAAALSGLGSVGLLISARRWVWFRECIAICLLVVSMSGIASYSFDLDGPASNDLFTTLAIHKSVLLLFATLGWMASAPTTGLTRSLTLDNIGGTVARWLLLPSLLLPAAFTFAFRKLGTIIEISESLALTFAATFSGGVTALMVWWMAVMLDRVEQQRKTAETLRGEATTDALTGLANRRAFDSALAGLQHSRREGDAEFSLLLLDLDKFKNYNDDFGHQAGDDALRATGRILRSALRPSDIPARYGGEEFAVLLPSTNAAGAMEVAERIVKDFRSVSWPHRMVTVSIGLAEARCVDGLQELIARADSGLYAAKRAGRNGVAVGDGLTRLVSAGA